MLRNMKLLFALLFATLGAGSVTAQRTPPLVIPPSTPPPLPIPDETLLQLGAVDLRMTVPVMIGTRGPWHFVIDTGAERTVIARELAGVLGLIRGPGARIVALTGTTPVETAIIPALRVSSLPARSVIAPALVAQHIGAQGLLGIDALQGHAVVIDFDRDQMTLTPAPRRSRGAAADEIVITARSRLGQLIVTDAAWRSTRIAVVIDTGTPYSIGNSALLRAMTRRQRTLPAVTLTSVTGESLVAPSLLADELVVGGIRFNGVPMGFADSAAFDRLGLGAKPALLLGMDVLRLFRRVAIDFPNRQIRFLNHRTDRGRPVWPG